MSIGVDVVSKLDLIKDRMSPEEKFLIDAFIDASNSLHNAGEMIGLNAIGSAKALCQSGSSKRQAALLNYIDSKLGK